MSARSARSAQAYTKDELSALAAYGPPSQQRSSRPFVNEEEEKGGEGKQQPGESKVKTKEEAYDGPLELEHVIGYTGAHPATFVAMPGSRDVYVKAMGSIVVVGDINDPHAQKLLRAHDEPVCALAVSRRGELIASGQKGATKVPGYAAPVIVWSATRHEPLFKLQGLTRGVAILAFSGDERFLAAAGEDGLVYIWDTATGEVVFGKRYAKRLAVLRWVAVLDRGRRRAYRLALGVEGVAELEQGELAFDATRQQWSLSTAPVAMPTAGMTRTYLCSGVVDYPALGPPSAAQGEKYLFAGTSEGDLVVMRLSASFESRTAVVAKTGARSLGGVYRASVPVCSGGLTAMAMQARAEGEDAVIFTGGGDGVVRRLVGRDLMWKLEGSVRLEGAITSLSFADDDDNNNNNNKNKNGGGATEELLVGTAGGRTCRVLLGAADISGESSSNSVYELSVAHVGKPTALGFGKRRPDVFATAASDGTVVVWDLSDYQALAVAAKMHKTHAASSSQVSRHRSRRESDDDDHRRAAPTLPDFGGGARCLCWLDDASVVAGFNDAAVRCYNGVDGREEWAIAGAHRSGVSACCAHVDTRLAYLVTASDDGCVRVWNLATREVMMHFAEHTKRVSTVLVDVHDPRLFHSAARDCAVFTHDLVTEKRTVSKVMRDGAFTGMTQRRDAERELVTCDASGRVLFWDCDVRDPVAGLSVDGTRVEAIAISPSGKFVALCRDELITVFQLDAKNNLHPIAEGWAHSDVVRAAHWSPDEKQVVTIADDACICVWNFFGTSP